MAGGREGEGGMDRVGEREREKEGCCEMVPMWS